MPTPSSTTRSNLDQQPHSRQSQSQQPQPSSPLSCPEDYHHQPSQPELPRQIASSSVLNVDDDTPNLDSTLSSPASHASGAAFRYDPDPDGPPNLTRIPPLLLPEMPSDASNIRSPSYASYTPISPPDAIRYVVGRSLDTSASASRSTTMSPRPHSRGNSTGSASGESNAATSPTADEDDEHKPMDAEDYEPRASERRHRTTSHWARSNSRVDGGRTSDDGHLEDDEDLIMDTDWSEYSSQSPALSHGFTGMRVVPSSPSTFLRPGSRFRGRQTSERSVYKIDVEIKHVDMRESFLCGYLHIEGLTRDNPSICTYFEGEIIGPKYGFLTRHQSWGADKVTDLSHWRKFTSFMPYWRKYKKGMPMEGVDFAQKENIFMRWKEQFLMPDHRKSSIPGASYEGFYYICFNQVRGDVKGIYFHHKSERVASLSESQQVQCDRVPMMRVDYDVDGNDTQNAIFRVGLKSAALTM
ncbi:vacuolar import and degradation protein [Zalerion maritima]|uniref:Vacuolar import and degradation protein n=1 Tax=Zalerion maritima TaxID=339359 RepID=A0AAD5WUR8_9PEZI|nr:vacuolar import and degradation protein [Zalerion maritima]